MEISVEDGNVFTDTYLIDSGSGLHRRYQYIDDWRQQWVDSMVDGFKPWRSLLIPHLSPVQAIRPILWYGSVERCNQH